MEEKQRQAWTLAGILTVFLGAITYKSIKAVGTSGTGTVVVRVGDNSTGGVSASVPITLPGGPTPNSKTYWPLRNFKTPHATVFLDKGYFAGYPNSAGQPTNKAVKGYWHTGTDMNGPGACCADQGDPIYAIRDGVVEWTGIGAGAWGRLFVYRVNIEGRTYWIRCGHVQQTGKTGGKVAPPIGSAIKGGQVVAFIGRGGQDSQGHYYWDCAHLHIDVFHTKPPRWDWWPTRYGDPAEVTAYCTDPVAFLKRLQAVTP